MSTAIDAQTASAAEQAGAPGVAQPGEFMHYYTNLLTLFGDRQPCARIEQMAKAAQVNRSDAMLGFSARLAELAEDFAAQRQRTGERANTQANPLLHGWERSPLPGLVETHGGVLVAMFHYAGHRHVFADLASMNLDFIAPVAKQAYFECSELATVAPLGFEQAMRLIEVEDPRVGRKLLSGLRQGRIGLLYADGNMGPDGHLVDEGGVTVDFLGKSIRVKAGVARLSISLGLPIVPLIIREGADGDGLDFGPTLLPPDKATLNDVSEETRAQQRIMQSLYQQLAQAVESRPERWEFAFCFHRWLDQNSAEVTESTPRLPVSEDQPLRLNPQRVTQMQRADGVYWIHVGRQRAYRLPTWAAGLYQRVDGTRSQSGLVADLHRAGADPAQARRLIGGLLDLQLIDGRAAVA